MSDSSRAAHPALLLCLVSLAVAGLLAVALLAPVAGDEGGTLASGSDTVAAEDAHNESALVASNTTILLELQPDGDAHWTITEHFDLATEWERQEFAEQIDEFEAEDVDGASLGLDGFLEASALVDAETDRSMEVTNVERTGAYEGDSGELVLSFTWENFGRVDGDRLYIDDVYETEGAGLWFPRLTENQRFIVASPDGFGFDAASGPIQDGRLAWDGPRTFTSQTLQATLVGNGGTDDGGTDDGGTDDGGAGNGNDDTGNGDEGLSLGLLGTVLLGLGGLAAVLVVAALAVGRGRLGAVLFPDEDEDEAEDGEGAHAAGAEQVAAGDDTEDALDVELLSDEERVERLLDRNGGRMKQANIVKETGWSNAKVSQLLSSMEREGRIDKLRIGRENLISFPEENVAEFDNE